MPDALDQRSIRERAAEILEGGGWTRGTWAKNRDGCPVRALDPSAVKWCVLGALDRAAYELGSGVEHARHWTREIDVVIRAEAGIAALGAFNDLRSTTDADVIALLRGERQGKE